jgi:8-oxo-dGTP pyrophosphatase MutT (NUDIX family)
VHLSEPRLLTLFRELFEECNLTAKNLDHVGIINEFVGEPRIMEVHVFKTSNYEGSIHESEGTLCGRFSIFLTKLASVELTKYLPIQGHAASSFFMFLLS